MPGSARRRRSLLFLAASCLLLLGCTSVGREEAPAFPEEEGLAAEIAVFGENYPEFNQLRAVVVAVDDDIVFEQYYETDQDAYWGMQSVTKSVLSTLIGIALDEGLISSVDDTLVDLLPAYTEVMSPTVAKVTLRRLLTMTGGFPEEDFPVVEGFVQANDWVRGIVADPDVSPDDKFRYSNASSHLISAILQEATGTSALDYARQRLFGPLDIDTRPALVRLLESPTGDADLEAYDRAGFAWPVDPQGVNTGAWGLKLRPRDMVKLGQLFLAGGQWNGQKLVSAQWVDEATSQQVAVGDGGYGYLWWTGAMDGQEAFHAIGFGGELIVAIPSRGLVVVTATEWRQSDPSSSGIETGVLTGLVEDVILPHFPPA